MHDLTYQLFIDGQWTPSVGDGVLEVENPATEEIIGAVPEASVADVDRAVAAARRAFDEGPWPRMSVRERSEIMLRMADAMERHSPELKELAVTEAGSTRALADTLQVTVPLFHFRDTAERVMLQFPFEKPMLPTFGPTLSQGIVRREPYGVAALIAAYNFPLYLAMLKLAPALAAGCTVVLKPAPTTPLETLALGKIAEEAGLPPGVLNIITGDIEAGQALTSHPGVDIISFTGSDTIGRQVYAQAAPTLKKVVLELGGKSANIITKDTDLELTIPSIMMGMLTHAGQGCTLLTRTLVHHSRLDEMVGLIKSALDQVKVGDPSDPATTMGPLISAAQRQKVENLIAIGQAEGAQLAYGGGRPAHLGKGYFVEPTLFVDVDNSMTIAQEEFFGPVGCVIGFEDEDEAIRIANDSKYGLGAGVWAPDPVHAYRIASQIRAGMVYINGGGAGSSPHTAFGGYKQSGLGLERGEFGLEEFLLTKSVIWSVR